MKTRLHLGCRFKLPFARFAGLTTIVSTAAWKWTKLQFLVVTKSHNDLPYVNALRSRPYGYGWSKF
jgi:phosphoglycerate-specific signal transduction histidine kinase